MQSVIYKFAWVEFKAYIRNRVALFWTFLNPLLMMSVLLVIFGGSASNIRLNIDMVVGDSPNKLISEIQKTVMDIEQGSSLYSITFSSEVPSRRGNVGIRLKGELVNNGEVSLVEIDPLYGENIHLELVQDIVERAVMTINSGGECGRPTCLKSVLNSKSSTENESIPYDQYLVIGMIIYAVLSVSLFGFSVPLVELKSSGAGRMYQIFPMSTLEFMLGFILARIFVVIFLGFSLSIFAKFAFGVDFPVHDPVFWFKMIMICSISGIAFISIGLFLASTVKSVAAATAINSLLFIPLTMFSDMFIPLSVFPENLAELLYNTPIVQFVNSSREIVYGGATFLTEWKSFALMLMVTIPFILISSHMFKWNVE